MSQRRILFVDRDGCLIEEPDDFQVDRFEKFALLPGVIAALSRCVSAGYAIVMVTNQDGLGTSSFPEAAFQGPQDLLMQILGSQGIPVREVLVDRSHAEEGRDTRKPGVGLVRHYLSDDSWSRSRSAMVGDRETDMEFARNLGVRGFRVGAGFQSWPEIAHALCGTPRTGSVSRDTRETRIRVRVDLDAPASSDVRTGLGFFDHMLEQIARHADFDLRLSCEGDTGVDEHHTIEDCALSLGEALREALGDKRGIGRYGFSLPMDESLASAALDLSGRSMLVFDGIFPRDRVGELPTELVPHFFRSLCDALGANLHLSVRGDNAHHMVEACFKVFARCLRQAIHVDGDVLPSTKGTL
ncbi:bifunctional histidinol-phosphatase/imidazoleglycerol-phosphate dehydratase HisB [Dokdonella sp.]|uniref:bifunctional histidinol-phosphatase/imidazoleglycerol-phosphate dehydratase HisB n=1 Tax=Dokdonella sp. TaxID=2291710 RepID=UPI003C3B18AB